MPCAPFDMLAKLKVLKANGLASNGTTPYEGNIQESTRARDISHVVLSSFSVIQIKLTINLGISNQPTAASFVRPTRHIDQPQSFLEALHQKYASEFEEELAKRKAAGHDDIQMNEPILFNGKVAEEVGFEKIRKQLAELQDLKFVILDNQLISGVFDRDDAVDEQLYREELDKIEQTCPKIVELDLSRNLLGRWRDVRDICAQLKQLRSLKLK